MRDGWCGQKFDDITIFIFKEKMMKEMKKYQRGFVQGIGENMAKAFYVALIFAGFAGVVLSLFAIYGIPAIWEWIKPFIHTITS